MITKEEYMHGAVNAGFLGLKSGVPEEQLQAYLLTNYKTVLSEAECEFAVDIIKSIHNRCKEYLSSQKEKDI